MSTAPQGDGRLFSPRHLHLPESFTLVIHLLLHLRLITSLVLSIFLPPPFLPNPLFTLYDIEFSLKKKDQFNFKGAFWIMCEKYCPFWLTFSHHVC